MFGLFRRKAPAPTPASSRPDLTTAQKQLIKEELERHAEGIGNDLDISIGLLHLTGDQQTYLKAVLKALENAQLGLLVPSLQQTECFLTLDRQGLKFLPVFTRPEHGQAVRAKFPSYQNMIFVPSRELFQRIELGFGLFINLGHPVFGYMMEPATFTTYRALLAKQTVGAISPSP